MLPEFAADHNAWGAVVIFFALLISHAVGDFALQSRFIAIAKNRGADLSELFPDGGSKGVWWNTLLAHSLIHAGGVWLVTGYVVLAFAELILHFLIDYAKSANLISFSLDQTLHRVCKLIYAVLLFVDPGWTWLTWSPV